jgi:hypothetical protein
LEVEAAEVESDELGVEDFDESVDRRVEAFGIEFFRQFADDGSFAIVRDAHAVAEHREQRLLASHQVGLHEVFADRVASVDLEGLVDPRVLLGHRFFLDENRAQFAFFGE